MEALAAGVNQVSACFVLGEKSANPHFFHFLQLAVIDFVQLRRVENTGYIQIFSMNLRGLARSSEIARINRIEIDTLVTQARIDKIEIDLPVESSQPIKRPVSLKRVL